MDSIIHIPKIHSSFNWNWFGFKHLFEHARTLARKQARIIRMYLCLCTWIRAGHRVHQWERPNGQYYSLVLIERKNGKLINKQASFWVTRFIKFTAFCKHLSYSIKYTVRANIQLLREREEGEVGTCWIVLTKKHKKRTYKDGQINIEVVVSIGITVLIG